MLRIGLLSFLISCGNVTSLVDAQIPTDGTDEVDADTCTAHGQLTFTATGTIQALAPSSCARTITIDAAGAQGGGSTTNNQLGGLGARIQGEFTLSPGVMLSVLVGSPGGTGTSVGGGGGGSFVWDPMSPTQPYLVAGGGGGAGFSSAGLPGLSAANGGNGGSSTAGGGSNGSGGVAPTPVTNWAAGGAGWASGGAGGGGTLATPCGLSTGGKAPRNGGQGGLPGGSSTTASGGFGGGGGGQGQCTATGGGGGGGYSGGGGGIDNISPDFTGGGGGGSYNAGTNSMNMTGVNAGAGSVTISW
jgi:hypothetical protein